MISLLKQPMENEPNHDKRIVEVSIEGWEISEDDLEGAFQVFATAVLGYAVRIEIFKVN